MNFETIWDQASNQIILQKKEELRILSEILLKENSRENLLEIGAHYGGSSLFFMNYYKNVYSIDKKPYYRGKNINQMPPNWNVIQGDSTDKVTIEKIANLNVEFDCLFIDGDHTYNGVRNDFFNYMPFVKSKGLIIFHDILASEYHKKQKCEVNKFWNEIKSDYLHTEICFIGSIDYIHPKVKWINEIQSKDWGGLGILWKG